MIARTAGWLRKKEWVVVLLLACIFVLVRLPGVHLPLHQDEYKWPMIVNPANGDSVSIPHPPLSEFIYRVAGEVVGFNVNFRLVPLFFGTANLLLLYYFMRMRFGRKEAFASSLIWIFSYFSILASLMVDTDGEIMPFFFLVALIGYYRMQKTYGRERQLWVGLFVLACIGGFFIKVSFLLVILAIAADFLWSKRNTMSHRDMARYAGYGFLGLCALTTLLIAARFIFPFFNLSGSVSYWEHFWTLDRGWLQTAIQCVKVLLYASPFLILVPFMTDRTVISKTKIFLFFLAGGLFFYCVLFDFSLGALDRYLQFIILPLAVLGGATVVSFFRHRHERFKEYILLGSAVAIILVLVQFLPHYVPPLHPKSEWIMRVVSLRWDFVYPFSGGSGPLGFYISFLFMALSWVISVALVTLALWKPRIRAFAMAFLISIGCVYNFMFAEEYLFGFINGSAPRLLSEAVQFIKDNPDIKMVTVYNDNGGDEIRAIGKYRKRLYVDPKFDIREKVATLNLYKEHYFVLDIPHLDPTSVYQKYFDSCILSYYKIDQKISAAIYDCRNAPDLYI